jgi:hypothetical protein
MRLPWGVLELLAKEQEAMSEKHQTLKQNSLIAICHAIKTQCEAGMWNKNEFFRQNNTLSALISARLLFFFVLFPLDLATQHLL